MERWLSRQWMNQNVMRVLGAVIGLILISVPQDSIASSRAERMKALMPLEMSLPREPSEEPGMEKIQLPQTPAVDLRNRDTAIKHQFGGACTAFGLTAAMENSLGGQLDLSERHVWSKYRKYSSSAAIKALTKSGAVEEIWWPQDDTRPRSGYTEEWWYRLLKTEYLDTDLSKALAMLEKEIPLFIAVATPQSMIDCDPVISPESTILNGGHALAVVGYQLDHNEKAGGYLLLKNSWGADCGDGGYQWLPLSICLRSDMYCLTWAIEQIEKY